MKKVLTAAACLLGLFVFAGVLISNGKNENSNTESTEVEEHANQAKMNKRHRIKLATSDSNTQSKKCKSHNQFRNSVSNPSNTCYYDSEDPQNNE